MFVIIHIHSSACVAREFVCIYALQRMPANEFFYLDFHLAFCLTKIFTCCYYCKIISEIGFNVGCLFIPFLFSLPLPLSLFLSDTHTHSPTKLRQSLAHAMKTRVRYLNRFISEFLFWNGFQLNLFVYQLCFVK